MIVRRVLRHLNHPLMGLGTLLVAVTTSAVILLGLSLGAAISFAVLALVLTVNLVVLSRLTATIRSLDSHIGATRQQMRVAVEQVLGGEADAQSRDEVELLRNRLWAGYEMDTVEELNGLIYGIDVERSVRSQAAAVLSVWQYASDAPIDAVRTVALSRIAQSKIDRDPRNIALEVDFLVSLGRLAEARALLDTAPRGFASTEACFRLANTYDPQLADLDEARLHHINSAFVLNSVAPLERRDPTERLVMSNLRGRAEARSVGNGGDPLVSVIMPMKNASSTIGYALRSVLEQTWSNLQVVVVDDGSEDGTASLVESIAATDSRIEIHRCEGRGAYVARNFGLSKCEGQYVTVHDADDWSHPEKIERQVRAMQTSDGKRASWSFWIRCSHDLVFCEPSLRPQYRQIVPNFSSFMVHRSVFDDLGSWDEAVVSSDAEFIRRLETFDGPESIVRVDAGVPLSFGLRSHGSLTGDGPAGVLTLHHVAGARRQYREAYRAWHQSASFRSSLPFDPRGELPFCRPRLMDPAQRDAPDRRDVVIVADCSERGGRCTALQQTALALAESGVRVGLIHLPAGRFVDGPAAEVLEVLDGERVRVISSGEAIATALVLVDDAAVLASPLVRAPCLSAGATLVLVRRPLHELAAPAVTASLASFGIASAHWQVTNPTLTSALAGLVRELGPEHTVEAGCWRDLVMPTGADPHAGAPQRVRVRVVGVAMQAQPGWARAHLRELGDRVVLSQGCRINEEENGHPGESDDGFDLAVLTATGEVPQNEVLAVLEAGVPIVADSRFRTLLGTGASYVDGSAWTAAIAPIVSEPSAWHRQAEATVLLASQQFSRDTLVESIQRQIARGEGAASS